MDADVMLENGVCDLNVGARYWCQGQTVDRAKLIIREMLDRGPLDNRGKRFSYGKFDIDHPSIGFVHLIYVERLL